MFGLKLMLVLLVLPDFFWFLLVLISKQPTKLKVFCFFGSNGGPEMVKKTNET